MLGQTYHDYEFLEEIGAGGYGVVYKAHEASVKRDVAIKVILSQHANKPEFQQRFAVEAQLVAQLEHPHIIPLYSYWQDAQGAFLVMRYINGGNLRVLINQQGALSFARTLRIIEQVVNALALAHENQVVHRDIKPANILLDKRGNAYLTDFGIAKQVNSDSHITDSDVIIGTFAYLSPEQIEASPINAQADIYALGILLYEMLTGEHPFNGTIPTLMIVKHLQEALPSVCAKRPELPADLDRIIQTATAKNPSERYPTVEAFLEDLLAAENTKATQTTVAVNPLSTTLNQQSPEARMRAALLRSMRTIWVDGVLAQSLHGAALMALGMELDLNANKHPWDRVLRRPDSSDEILPSNTHISRVFDQLNGKMLILGEPGSGKTTTLLQLARELIQRAEWDSQAPLPVILNLAPWGERPKPMRQWLTDEIVSKYQVSRKVVQTWLDEDAFVLLLDGLDEVAEYRQNDCVQAINDYRSEQAFSDMLVCSRIKDYSHLSNRLQVNGAIVLRPLSNQQIDTYLASFGAGMATIRAMVQKDEGLRELLRAPLMLSIVALAYQDASSTGQVLAVEGAQAQRQHIFELFVNNMYQRYRGEKSYSLEQTMVYLKWLAEKMRWHGQMIFAISEITPKWLPTENHLRFYYVIFAIFNALIFAATVYAMRLMFNNDFGFGIGLFWGAILVLSNVIDNFQDNLTTKVQLKFKRFQQHYLLTYILPEYSTFFSIIVPFAFSLIMSRFVMNQLEPISTSLLRAALSGILLGFAQGYSTDRGWNLLKYLAVRIIFFLNRRMPFNYERFLNFACELLFMQHVGESYGFVHRYVLDYFADWKPNSAQNKKAASK